MQLKSVDQVLVINSLTNESKEVKIGFLQEAARDSLMMLFQYKYYELIINAEEIWKKVQCFNPEIEKIKENYIEQEFKRIISNNEWMKITDHDREMYNKALSTWANSYNSQPNKQSFDKFVFIPVAGGAMAGALTYSTIGGVGIAASGSALGIGSLGLTALGTIGGLAVYGASKAFH
ncbi:hypothetical protein [Pleurocapsa sp. CCALA 161]|uniref:hypothetical protein n=1 Tax=Pleurocapsa sp. CCALA 161 TaxID=2107688 RepID=UPI0011B1EBF4|nr:hypothetical protein [Pleurocapsa sp. CCALA 161]